MPYRTSKNAWRYVGSDSTETSAPIVLRFGMLMRTPIEPQKEPPWEPWEPSSRIWPLIAVALAVMALPFILVALKLW